MTSHLKEARAVPWTVYILLCADLYTGITTDIETRLAKHENGTGAKYTRGRAPYTLLYTETHDSKSDALKRELAIKSLSRQQKLALTNGMADA
jgi:predicted GIY-YIG superfamily endonuclease